IFCPLLLCLPLILKCQGSMVRLRIWLCVVAASDRLVAMVSGALRVVGASRGCALNQRIFVSIWPLLGLHAKMPWHPIGRGEGKEERDNAPGSDVSSKKAEKGRVEDGCPCHYLILRRWTSKDARYGCRQFGEPVCQTPQLN